MKKLFILLLLVLPTFLQAQSFFDAPSRARMDTVTATTTRATRDIYFNPANAAAAYIYNSGSIDLNIIVDMWSTSETTDTLTVELYGLTVINFLYSERATYDPITYPTDSTRLGTIPITTTETIHIYALEEMFPTFYQYDGVRVVYKEGGSDADSVKVYTNCRVYNPWVGSEW